MEKISKSRKWFYYCLFTFLIILIILPYTINGFRLRDLSERSDNDDKSSTKKMNIRDTTTHTKSFRKIVKIIHVDDDGTEIEETLNNHDDNNNNDDDIVIESDDDNDIDNEKYEFEKVHRSDFNKPSSQSIFKTIIKEEEKEEDANVEEASQKLAFVFPSIFNFFGSSIPSPPVEEESNGIINWIQSFLGTKSKEKLISKDLSKSESWTMSYLNRWPFNAFIPFEKSDPKIWIPPTIPTIISQDDIKEPLTQEHFDYLLYHFPNFILKPTDIQEIDCKTQVLIFQRQLRGNKLWTLQMLDSSAKFPSGILKGNTNQFGDFDTCTQIRTLVKIKPEITVKIKGKYCLAHIDLKYSDNELKFPVYLAQGKGMWKGHIGNPGHLIPRYTTMNWGICVPHQCSHKEIFRMLENSLKPYNSTGINFHIKIKEDDCFTRKQQNLITIMMTNTKVMFTIGFYLTLLGLVLIATIIDYWDYIKDWASQFIKQNETNGKSNKNQSETEISSDTSKDLEDKNEDIKKNIEDMKNSNDFERITSRISSGVILFINSIQKHFWIIISYVKSLYYQLPEHNRATISKLSYEILLSFSLKRTIPGLTYSDPEIDIVLVHTLKIISTLILYMFTKFLMLGHLSIVNRDEMVKTLTSPFSIILRTPLVYLDTLLLIAGLLSSREMCKQLEQNAKISVLKIIVGKCIRSLPTLFAVLLFQSWILPFLGSGPLWQNLVQTNAELCDQNLWRNIFGVQNFINIEESCSPLTIQLALDLQLLVIGCLLVWLYYNNEDIGLGIYGIFHAISVGARFSHTNLERLSSVLFHGMNVSKFYRTANILYSSPIDRATAYLIGIGAGVLIWTSDTTEINLPISASILAWTSSILGVLWCFWYPWYNTKMNFIYDPLEAATYSSWAPLFLSLSLAWIIFASSFTTSPLNPIFSSRPLVFLSKIAYPMQLVIFGVVMYNTALNREPIRFQTADLMDFTEIFIIIILSTAIAIVIDYPFQNIRKVLLETEFSMVSSHEEEDKEGGDADEQELIEDENEQATKVEEDPVEDIWGGSENDEKYSTKNHDQSPENWRTESDLEKYHSELMSDSVFENRKTQNYNTTEEEKEEEEKEEEEEEGGGEEEIQEITKEEKVVIRRPSSSEQSYRRRNWRINEI